MRVGFIGLGIMGQGMARNLLAGHALTVWNRTPARADELRSAGARWAETPRELASRADAVCTCVSDGKVLRAVAEGPDGFLAGLTKGTLVIDFSTIGPTAALWMDAACRERGARFLESPVTGSKNGAATATLLLMCGGDAATFADAQPILGAVGKKAIHVGAVGQAAHVKLAGNLIIGHMLEGLSEGAALARRAGVSLETLLQVIQSSGYASPFWDFKGKALAAGDFSTHFSIDLMHKDLSLALAAGEATGVSMPGTAAVRGVYDRARERGLGARDIVATAAVADDRLAIPAEPSADDE